MALLNASCVKKEAVGIGQMSAIIHYGTCFDAFSEQGQCAHPKSVDKFLVLMLAFMLTS